MARRMLMIAAAMTAAACDRTGSEQPRNAAANTGAPVSIAHREQAAPATAMRREPPRSVADERTALAEPKGPIDPKSAEAAGQVVQHYGALIEQKRFAEAESLWGDATPGRQFSLELERYLEVHCEIGKPGDMEGAAGSSYVTEPVVFYGKLAGGSPFRRSANVILRRVNDVPGSTEAQRRWHIERIEWTNRPATNG
jgi:hypothetical protein